MNQFNFANAQQLAQCNPMTFKAPNTFQLGGIKQGDFVKVCACGERFWVIVDDVNGMNVTGTIDNDLIGTIDHGLSIGDSITFQKKNIYEVKKS